MSKNEMLVDDRALPYSETQVHAWIHPDGMFEMNVRARDREELEQVMQLISIVVEKY